jgi:hypothetical protein
MTIRSTTLDMHHTLLTVAVSVNKLLSRIVAPDIEYKDEATLNDHTYNITSDPLTQFACVFSTIIHDVDHKDVLNAQLVREKASVVAYYGGKTIAGQKLVDLAWQRLMDDESVN